MCLKQHPGKFSSSSLHAGTPVVFVNTWERIRKDAHAFKNDRIIACNAKIEATALENLNISCEHDLLHATGKQINSTDWCHKIRDSMRTIWVLSMILVCDIGFLQSQPSDCFFQPHPSDRGFAHAVEHKLTLVIWDKLRLLHPGPLSN
jgi:hypothetical protein